MNPNRPRTLSGAYLGCIATGEQLAAALERRGFRLDHSRNQWWHPDGGVIPPGFEADTIANLAAMERRMSG